MIRDLIFLNMLTLLPRFKGDVLLRPFLLRGAGAAIGSRVKIKAGIAIEPIGGARKIRIGSNTFINSHVRIAARSPVTIGSNCAIGPGVYFETVNHSLKDDGSWATTSSSITIGDNVWIGARATILPGITIGPNAQIAAGAVVTKDIGPGDRVGGIPARSLRAQK